jgi:hypothetical protein
VVFIIQSHNKVSTCLQSLWTHFITPSWKFVEVQWWSLFQSTSLGKQCTSYNAPSTSQKCAADHWSLQNFLPWSSLFMVGKAQKLPGGEIWIEFCVWIGKSGPVEAYQNICHNSPDLTPCDFWAFPTMKWDLRGKKFRTDQWPAAHFWEAGGAL